MFVFDVSINAFRKFRTADNTFIWIDTDDAFVLFKPTANSWLRCRVNKSHNQDDQIWASNNLGVPGAIKADMVTDLSVIMQEIAMKQMVSPNPMGGQS